MTIVEMIVTMAVLAVCGIGLAWLFYDIHRMIKRYEQTEAERCEGLDTDDDGDRE